MIKKAAELVSLVRDEKPLVHHITNYVTVNDCANIKQGIVASPIMADDLEEAADIAAISRADVRKRGTVNERTTPSQRAQGREAKAGDVPVLVDTGAAGS